MPVKILTILWRAYYHHNYISWHHQNRQQTDLWWLFGQGNCLLFFPCTGLYRVAWSCHATKIFLGRWRFKVAKFSTTEVDDRIFDCFWHFFSREKQNRILQNVLLGWPLLVHCGLICTTWVENTNVNNNCPPLRINPNFKKR